MQNISKTTLRPAPGQFKTITVVVELTLRLWLNGILKHMSATRKTATMISAVVLFMGAYGILGVLFFRNQIPLDDPEIISLYVGLLLPLMLVLFSVFLAVLCFIYSPPAANIMAFLNAFALKQHRIHRVLSWLSLALAIMFAFLFCLPMLLYLLINITLMPTLLCLFYAIFLIILSAFSTHTLLNILTAVPTLFHKPATATIRGLAALVAVGFLCYPAFQAISFNGSEPHGPIVYYGAIFSAIVTETPLTLSQLAAIILPSLMLLAFTVLLQKTPMPTAAAPRRAARNLLKPTGRRVALPLLEAKQWRRFPNNTVNLVFILGLGAALIALHLTTNNTANIFGLNLLLPLLFGTISVSFYGLTQPYHWLYRTLRPPAAVAWIWPKFWAAVALWGALLLSYTLIMIITGGISPVSIIVMLPTLFLELTLGLTIGLFFLASKEQSLGTTIAEGVTTFAIIFITFGVETTLASTASLPLVLLIKGILAAAAVVLYYGAARARERQDTLKN